MNASLPNRMIFITDRIHDGADDDDWRRRVDYPFFNAIPGIKRSASRAHFARFAVRCPMAPPDAATLGTTAPDIESAFSATLIAAPGFPPDPS